MKYEIIDLNRFERLTLRVVLATALHHEHVKLIVQLIGTIELVIWLTWVVVGYFQISFFYNMKLHIERTQN